MQTSVESEMEAEVIEVLDRVPSTQIIPTLGPKVCKYYLFGSLGLGSRVHFTP